MKIKNVLVSQPQPEGEKSPYSDLAKHFNLKIEFRKFIKIENIGAKDFRKYRINIPDYTAIIFTSRHAVDNFFTLCEEVRVSVSENLKYFCTSEAIALYLQKYVQFRKRKIFFGKNTNADLFDLVKKQKTEKFLFPCAENHSMEIPNMLETAKIDFTVAPIYRTVSDNLSDVKINDYDMLVFFSPFGIKSLFENFPDFVQGETVIGAFGDATSKAAIDAGLTLNLHAPTESAPSMTMAIEQFLAKNQKK